MSSIDQQFVEFIVKSLVGNPDDVSIERTIDEKGVLLKLTVAGDDLGRVIGKRGATAQSIRTLLRALGTKNEARYNLKIVDPDQPETPKKEENREEEQSESESQDAPEEIQEEPVAEAEEEVVEQEAEAEAEEETTEDEEESYGDKHRAGLDDLDDLDI